MFEASEALQKMEGMKKIKSTSFHQYSWNSEVETIWISLIGWHHKTSNIYYCDRDVGRNQNMDEQTVNMNSDWKLCDFLHLGSTQNWVNKRPPRTPCPPSFYVPALQCYFFQLLSLILDLRGNLPHTHTYYRTRYVVRPSGPSLTTKPTTASNTSTSKWKPWRNHEVRLCFS